MTDEQLQREFFRDNLDREIESEEDGEYSKMKERLLILLPSLRTTTNANNNERLVEDLLFRVGLERVSSRLLSMRKIFPTCDVAEMASKNPKVYLNFSSSDSSSDSKIERCAEEDKREDIKIEREWRMEIDTLEDMFPFAGQNGLPNVQRMVQAVPQMLDSRFVQRSIQALISSKYAREGRARRENETAPKSAFDIKRGILQQPIAVRERESFRSNQREKEQSCLPRLESEGDVLRYFVIKVVIIRSLMNNVSTLTCFFLNVLDKNCTKLQISTDQEKKNCLVMKQTQKQNTHTHETHMRAHSSFSFSYFCTTNHRANTKTLLRLLPRLIIPEEF